MNSSKEILADLRDNQGGLSRQGGYCLPDEDYDKGLLRLLASSSVKDLASNHHLLVYPQSFGQGDGTSRILAYDENEDMPDTVYTNNMMGFVGRNDTDIFIHSRFGSKENDYFLHYMLMKIGGLDVFNFSTSIDVTQDKIHNLLIYLFPTLLNKALAKGLLKTYIHKAYNNSNVRGKIDIFRHIKRNEPFTGRMAYDVREYSADNVVTELIRHCVEHLQHSGIGRSILRCDKTTMDNVELIKKITPSYTSGNRERIITKNLKAPIHPLYADYRPLQKLCIAILQYKRIDYGKGKNKVHGILFDGSWLWEEYLSRVLEGIMVHRYWGDGKSTIHLFLRRAGSSSISSLTILALEKRMLLPMPNIFLWIWMKSEPSRLHLFIIKRLCICIASAPLKASSSILPLRITCRETSRSLIQRDISLCKD